jgi:hypothetical protein
MVDHCSWCVVGSGGRTGYVRLSTVLVHRLHKSRFVKIDAMSRIASISTNRLEDSDTHFGCYTRSFDLNCFLQTKKKVRSNDRIAPEMRVTIQWSRMFEAIERSTENCRGEF